MPAKLSCWMEGSCGPTLHNLGSFLDANEFYSEELSDILYDLGGGRSHIIGGGASPAYIIKLYEPGDEDLSFGGVYVLYREQYQDVRHTDDLGTYPEVYPADWDDIR